MKHNMRETGALNSGNTRTQTKLTTTILILLLPTGPRINPPPFFPYNDVWGRRRRRRRDKGKRKGDGKRGEMEWGRKREREGRRESRWKRDVVKG